MASITGNNYFTKSMNSIIEIDDRAGTVISDGIITTKNISTTFFNTNSLNCDAIDATTGNFNEVNSTNINNSGTMTTGIISSTNINNSGTITTDIISSNNINNLNKIITDILQSITINNSDTISSATLTSTFLNCTGIFNANNSIITNTTITNANITNANITNATFNISANDATFQNIQPITPSNTTNLFTNSTTTVSIGGSGIVNIGSASVYLSKNGNQSLETGTTATTAYLDFHSGNNTNDYDARIISTGGISGSLGKSVLNFEANKLTIKSLNIPVLKTFYATFVNASNSGALPFVEYSITITPEIYFSDTYGPMITVYNARPDINSMQVLSWHARYAGGAVGIDKKIDEVRFRYYQSGTATIYVWCQINYTPNL